MIWRSNDARSWETLRGEHPGEDIRDPVRPHWRRLFHVLKSTRFIAESYRPPFAKAPYGCDGRRSSTSSEGWLFWRPKTRRPRLVRTRGGTSTENPCSSDQRRRPLGSCGSGVTGTTDDRVPSRRRLFATARLGLGPLATSGPLRSSRPAPPYTAWKSAQG